MNMQTNIVPTGTTRNYPNFINKKIDKEIILNWTIVLKWAIIKQWKLSYVQQCEGVLQIQLKKVLEKSVEYNMYNMIL